MPNEQPQTAIDKFTTRLKVLQGSLGRLQPSLILVLRILVTYTISVVDYVFSAIPARAEQVQPQQIQIKRIACKTLCIPVRTPNKMLWASIDDLGFAVPHIFTRLQLQYIKGLFSAFTAEAATPGKPSAPSCCTRHSKCQPTQTGSHRNNGWPATASHSTYRTTLQNLQLQSK